jgi:hypothetical protein
MDEFPWISKRAQLISLVASAFNLLCLTGYYFTLQVLLIVKKTTGGKAWLPKWGLTGLTRTQKANRRKTRDAEHSVLSTIKEAAKRQPAEPNATTATGTH